MNKNLEDIGKKLHKGVLLVCVLDGEEPQYFLFVERQALFFVTTTSRAIMFWFILHYVFNLEYCPQVKHVCFFFQECVFNYLLHLF